MASGTAERVLRLLLLLQRRPLWRGDELAAELGVDQRTVRRDIERARSLGYDVASVTGTAGGYRLVSAKEMPPLLLDEDESVAIAVLLGVSATLAGPGLERAALATLARVDRLLPKHLRNSVRRLRETSVALVPAPDAVPAHNLARLAEGCAEKLVVCFEYCDRSRTVTTRRAEPYRLVATDRRWYLVAFDLDRSDWRTFRVDRVKDVKVTGHTFSPRPLADPAELVSHAIAAAPYLFEAVVRIDAPEQEVRKRVPPHVGRLEAHGSTTVLRLGADEVTWAAGYLVGLGLPFEALDPPELRTELAALGERLRRKHSPFTNAEQRATSPWAAPLPAGSSARRRSQAG
ncbi:MAG TPA: YafY family protein [Acidimicrobiales bacterium]|nr:YafY family protein [Acidimicrobiales bacterium]